MDLSAHKKTIETEFSQYEALQARHLEMLKQDDLVADMKQLVFERQQASDRLQKSLNTFMENAGSLGRNKSVKLLDKFENRLNNIMALDEHIASEIERHRGVLKKELSQMKQGKRAIQGYGSAGHPPKTRPRVFSISR